MQCPGKIESCYSYCWSSSQSPAMLLIASASGLVFGVTESEDGGARFEFAGVEFADAD